MGEQSRAASELKPSWVRMEVSELPPDWHERYPHGWGGHTLRGLRQRLGGEVGELKDSWGFSHELSLERWRDADPDHTLISIGWQTDPGYSRESTAARWRQVPAEAWMTVEELAAHAVERARVVMVNEVVTGQGVCRRTRVVGRRFLPVAHEAGAREILFENLTPQLADEISATRQLPADVEPLAGHDDLGALIADALRLGWSIRGFAHADPALAAAPLYPDMAAKFASLDAELAKAGSRAKVLVWYVDASLLLYDKYWRRGVPDPDHLDQVAPPLTLDNVAEEDAFLIDQMRTVPFGDPGSYDWPEDLSEWVRPALERLGGTAAILARDAPTSKNVDAFILSTDNRLEAR